MMLRKKIVSVLFISCCSGAACAWPVTIVGNIPGAVDQAANIAKYTQQVILLEQQYSQLQQTFNSLNGLRSVGGLMKNELLSQYLPPDYQQAYAALRGGRAGSLSGISGTLNQIAAESQYQSCDKTHNNTASITACNRDWQTLSMNRYVGQAGYDQTATNIANLRKYVDTLTATPDQKGVADLQARIAIEQVKMQNEQMKLQTMAMLVKAEEDITRARNAEATGAAFTKPMTVRWGPNANN